MRELDELDLELLRLVQEDARLTHAELARRVHLSPPSVQARLKRLESDGFVEGYTAVIRRQAVGFGLTAYVFIQLALHEAQAMERFQATIVKLPEVLECHNISGEYDYMLKVVITNMEAYEQFIRLRLAPSSGVGRIQTSFVINTTKETHRLPIGESPK